MLKNTSEYGLRGYDSMIEHQLACPLWRIFPLGTRVVLWNRANGKRAIFRVFLAGDVFRENKAHVQGNLMQVFVGRVTSHRSQNESSKMRERGSKDGDKLLCNRCPLKHEARERERGEMLYKKRTNQKHCHRRTCAEKYN